MEQQLPICYNDGVLYPGKCDNEPDPINPERGGFISPCSVARLNFHLTELPERQAFYGSMSPSYPDEPCISCAVYINFKRPPASTPTTKT